MKPTAFILLLLLVLISFSSSSFATEPKPTEKEMNSAICTLKATAYVVSLSSFCKQQDPNILREEVEKFYATGILGDKDLEYPIIMGFTDAKTNSSLFCDIKRFPDRFLLTYATCVAELTK
jgi:hypothetical protein